MKNLPIIILFAFTSFISDSGAIKVVTETKTPPTNNNNCYNVYYKHIIKYRNGVTKLKQEVKVLSSSLNILSKATLNSVTPKVRPLTKEEIYKVTKHLKLNITQNKRRRRNGCPEPENVKSRLINLPIDKRINIHYAGMSNPSENNDRNDLVVQTCKECYYDITLPGYHPSQIRHVECPQVDCMTPLGLCVSKAMETQLYSLENGVWIPRTLMINKGCCCQMRKIFARYSF